MENNGNDDLSCLGILGKDEKGGKRNLMGKLDIKKEAHPPFEDGPPLLLLLFRT